MRQYWNIKKEHYDKIVMFKMGKFYEMFFDDSLVGKKELNLNFAGGKMHVGFPEKSLDRYTHELVQQGYKVVVVEQMETVDMMKERNKKEGRGSERTLAREITQVLTKGTFVYEGDEEQYLPNFLITVVRQQNTIGYALLEMGTNALLLGVSQSFE